MTREEEKKKARWEYVNKRLANPDFPTYNAEYELEAAFDKGYEEAIDKACEWFEEKACCGWIEDVEVKYFIEQFRKAMKGEQI